MLVLTLEQSGNLAGLIYIDPLCSRTLRQTRHRHDLAGQRYDEACACGNLQVADSYLKIGRCAELRLIVCQGVLRLCYTDRAVAVAHILKLLCLLLRICSQNRLLATVNLLNDLVQLILDAALAALTAISLNFCGISSV